MLAARYASKCALIHTIKISTFPLETFATGGYFIDANNCELLSTAQSF